MKLQISFLVTAAVGALACKKSSDRNCDLLLFMDPVISRGFAWL